MFSPLRKLAPVLAFFMAVASVSPACAATVDPTPGPVPIAMRVLVLYVTIYSDVIGLLP